MANKIKKPKKTKANTVKQTVEQFRKQYEQEGLFRYLPPDNGDAWVTLIPGEATTNNPAKLEELFVRHAREAHGLDN